MRRIGIISGVADELGAFLPGVPRVALRGAPAVQGLTHGGKDLFLACAGIGKVAAATAATVLHIRHGVELLLVIGTAGKIGAIDGGPFNIVEAVQADFGAQRPGGLVHYTAGSWPIGPARVEAFRAATLPDLGLGTARIATSDLFVECGIHAARVREALDVTLIDMETAAVAHAASLLGVPWAAIKATTDEANGDSAASFTANLEAAARASAEAAERLIAAL